MDKDTLPIVHLNGTSREVLVKQRMDAVHGLRGAIDAFYNTAPNARDYYPEPGRLQKARTLYVARLTQLEDMVAELEAEASELQDGGR